MSGDGWIGSAAALKLLLAVVGADTVAPGVYHVTGTVAGGYLGDVVVGADATYYLDGAPRNLAAALRAQSQGHAVAVFAGEARS